MVLTQIAVRTASDKEQEQREALLMEAVWKENENPFQQMAEALIGSARRLYSDYFYTSGTMLFLWTWWGLYPRYARFRHKHLTRFGRRKQVEFRRYFFYTRHIPKWDKKYLQRLELPRRVPPQRVSSSGSLDSSTEILVREPQVGGSLQDLLLDARRTEAASFAGGTLGKMESSIVSGINAMNDTLKQQISQRGLLEGGTLDTEMLQQDVMRLVRESKGVVVLKETHETRRSVRVDREVWWVSLEEAQRRREWWFWLRVLVAARILEDLLDMPDMPDFAQ